MERQCPQSRARLHLEQQNKERFREKNVTIRDLHMRNHVFQRLVLTDMQTLRSFSAYSPVMCMAQGAFAQPQLLLEQGCAMLDSALCPSQGFSGMYSFPESACGAVGPSWIFLNLPLAFPSLPAPLFMICI